MSDGASDSPGVSAQGSAELANASVSDDGTFLTGDGESPPTPQGQDRAPPPYAPGQQLGAYRLHDLIGEGGMGYVYQAEHARLGRKVALKLLRPEYAGNPKAVSRFFGEARAVNQICHENIVEITDFIEKDGDEKYYIMELLQGLSLRDILNTDLYLPLARTVPIAVQVTSALSAVHQAGMVHRDLKPDNIYLVEKSGRQDFVKLLDFGVAKLADPISGASVGETQAGAILGTPSYMSPEQAGGDEVDFRSDLYALGVILYETLTGQKPFTGKNFGELVVKHMTVAPTRPSKLEGLPQPLPADLEELILALLEKEPEDRPANMAEVGASLQTVAGMEALPLESYVVPRSSRTPMWLAGAAVAVLLPLGLWALSGEDAPPEPPPVEVPAAPTEVMITFTSIPAGAEVYAAGSEEALGQTPYTHAAQRGDDALNFELKLAGYDPSTQTVVPDADARIAVQLAKAKPVVVKRPPRKRPTKRRPTKTTPTKKTKTKKVDRTGVIDPFAD